MCAFSYNVSTEAAAATVHRPPLIMVKETVHHTSSLFPSVQLILHEGCMRRERERLGQRRKREEECSLSPINIMSMGVQNGLCQQNTDLLLSGEEHEDEREKKAKGGRGITTASCKSVFYMEHPIYHLLLEMESEYMSVTESETSPCEIRLSLASISFSAVTTAIFFQFRNANRCLNNREQFFKLIPLSSSNSKELIHECFISFTFVKMTAL